MCVCDVCMVCVATVPHKILTMITNQLAVDRRSFDQNRCTLWNNPLPRRRTYSQDLTPECMANSIMVGNESPTQWRYIPWFRFSLSYKLFWNISLLKFADLWERPANYLKEWNLRHLWHSLSHWSSLFFRESASLTGKPGLPRTIHWPSSVPPSTLTNRTYVGSDCQSGWL